VICLNYYTLCRILGSHAGGYKDFYLQGYNAARRAEHAACFMLVACLGYYSTLKLEAKYFSEASVGYTAFYPRKYNLCNTNLFHVT
jgi:hypothetical protein